MPVLAYVERPLATLNADNRLLLADLPSRAICVQASDMRDALVRVVSVRFSYAFDFVRHLYLH